jgi:hypothetical protein
MTEEAATVEATPDVDTPLAAPAEATPDIGESLAAVNQRLDALSSRLPESEAPAETPGSEGLFEQLLAEAEAYQPEPEAQVDPAASPEVQQQQHDEAMAQLAAFVDQRTEAALTPHFAALEQQRRSQEFKQLESTYPDIRKPDVLSKVFDRLNPIVEEAGDESLLTHPALVRMAYEAIKAEAASASETPAEDAVGRGAVVETGAGGRAPDTQLTPEEQIRQDLRAISGHAPTPFG